MTATRPVPPSSASLIPLFNQSCAAAFSNVMILSIASDGIGAGVSTLLRLPLSPHFENIYLSTSSADFWNKRWNQIVSGLLRATVYDPLMEGTFVGEGRGRRRWRAAAGQRRALGVPAALHCPIPACPALPCLTTHDPCALLPTLLAGRLVHREGAPAAAFSRARRMVAVPASFVVSGLLHEMLIWYPTGHASHGLLW